GNDLLQKFELFSAQLRGHCRQTRDRSAGPSEARNEPCANGIGDLRHDDGNRRRGVLGGARGERTSGHDHVDLQTRERDRESTEAIRVSVCITEIEDDGLALHVAQLAKTLTKCLDANRVGGRRAPNQNANSGNLLRLLRSSREWPKQVESDNDRESDPPHGHLVGMAAGSLADDGCSKELAALVE